MANWRGVLALMLAGIVTDYSPVLSQVNPSEEIRSRSDDAIEKRLDSFIQKYSRTLGYYYKQYETINEIVSSGVEPILKGLSITAGDPVVVDGELIERIRSQKELYERLAKQLRPPIVPNPMNAAPQSELESADPGIRLSALQNIERQLTNYEVIIQRYEEKRHQAARIAVEADNAYDRVRELEKKLNEINVSPMGVILNAATENKFSWLWLDTATTLFDAVAARAGAAHDLLGSYDRALIKMRSALGAYDSLRSWVRFYKVQTWLRQNIHPPAGTGPSDSRVDSLFLHAQDSMGRARAQAESASRIQLPSRETEKIEKLRQGAHRQVETAQKAIDELWKQAQEADDADARHQETMALIGLALGAANLVNASMGASSSSGAEPTAGATGSFEYKSPNLDYKWQYQITIIKPQTNLRSPKAP